MIQVVELDEYVADHYAQIRHDLSSKGQIIGANDLWLAAHARANNWVMVTNNEKAGVVAQIIRDFSGRQGRFFHPGGNDTFHNSILPSKTVTAGPVMKTGLPLPAQSMDSVPPGSATVTGVRKRPRSMPTTAAAQAPLPQASVSPEPRSNTRRRA